MIKKILAFCLLTIISNYLTGQNNHYVDSLIQTIETHPDDSIKVGTYGTLHEQLMFSQPEKALDYAKKAFELSKRLDYTAGIAGSNIQFGNYYYNKNLLDSAKHFYREGLRIAEANATIITQIFANHSLAAIEIDLGNYDEAIEIVFRNINLYKTNQDLTTLQNKIPFSLIGAEYELLGQIHLLKGNYHIALKETLNALHFFEKNKDQIRQADALNQLGKIEYLLDNPDSAISYCEQALEVYKSFDDKYYQATASNQIGECYIKLNDLENAKIRFNDALQLANEVEALNEQAKAIESLGQVFMAENDYKSAKANFESAFELYEKIGNKNAMAVTLSRLADVELAKKNWKNTLQHLNQSIVISNDIGANINLSQAYLSRSKVYENLNQSQLALQDLKHHQIISDSIFNSTKSKQIEELRTIYETEKKEQQIQIQKNEIELLNTESKVNNLQRLLLGLGLLLALIGMYALYQKIKTSRIAQEKMEADLEFKSKELTTYALHLAKKNDLLTNLKRKAQDLKESSKDSNGYHTLIRTINFDLQDDNNWENFSRIFEGVYKDFYTNAQVKYPNITSNDLRLMSLLKMNLSSKEIANILNISNDGIKKARQRLRRKMELEAQESLEARIIAI